MGHNEIPDLLHAAAHGDDGAADRLLPLIYDELRRLAAHMMQGERPGQTLQATALVHEAYLRLVGAEHQRWEDQRHFFNACAMAMRRVLLDRARMKGRVKHGGHHRQQHVQVIDIPAIELFGLEDFEAVEAALIDLKSENPRWIEVVQLRLFLGLSLEQTAAMLGISPGTVKNDTRFAVAYIRQRVGAPKSPGHPDET
ncbi:MAG: sigma-70 family RNA polymerase sigma factor [Phycisphaerales bacterium]|nr:sigma-70 family RNA polymerase sigma factor [Phycisphaerales bacterium]